jgi:serine protease
MANFVSQMGGTAWAGVQTQYYETDARGHRHHITNPRQQLAGLWVDDRSGAGRLPKTSANNPHGATNTYTDLAREAARAVRHFHIRHLTNADVVIAQPPRFSDPNALAQGYCAFHDYTQPSVQKGIYDGIRPGISYINLPYQLQINSNGANVCGKNFVNPGAAGKLDGFSIVLGHEIEEAVTDPGAEDVLGGAGLGRQRFLGGWYDVIDGDENGDKCAWVGTLLEDSKTPSVMAIPGAIGNIRGNRGTVFPVQSLWSNRAAGGLGYCAGANTDLHLG